MATSVNTFLGDCASLVKGLAVTLRTMFRPAVTVQYPDEKLVLPERWRGVLSLEVSKCLVCMACVRACPARALSIKYTVGPDKKRRIDAFPWLDEACAHCDMCVNACPTGALAFYHDYEIASFSRDELFVDLAKAKTAEVGDLPTGLGPGQALTIAAGGAALPAPEQSP